jgi:hypothetical protein
MASTLASWVGPGDQAIVPAFIHPSWIHSITLRGGIPVFYDCHWPEMAPSLDMLAACITNRTRMVLDCSIPGSHKRELENYLLKRDLPLIQDLSDWPMQMALNHLAESFPMDKKSGGIAIMNFSEHEKIMIGWGWAQQRLQAICTPFSAFGNDLDLSGIETIPCRRCGNPKNILDEINPSKGCVPFADSHRSKADSILRAMIGKHREIRSFPDCAVSTDGAGFRLSFPNPSQMNCQEFPSLQRVKPIFSETSISKRFRINSDDFPKACSCSETSFYLSC